jgi:molybdopterin converting factor small subunit
MERIKVKVKYFTMLRDLVGRREVEYEVEKGMSLIDFLYYYLPKKHAQIARKFRETIFQRDEKGRIKLEKGKPVLEYFYTILVNKENIRRGYRNLEYILQDGDIITILPPAGGG